MNRQISDDVKRGMKQKELDEIGFKVTNAFGLILGLIIGFIVSNIWIGIGIWLVIGTWGAIRYYEIGKKR